MNLIERAQQWADHDPVTAEELDYWSRPSWRDQDVELELARAM